MKMATAMAVACLSVVALAAGNDAQAVMKQYDLNIPKQSLDMALRDLAQQTGLQIALLSDTVDGDVIVGPISGTQSADDALRLLLASSGLSYKVVSEGTIAVLNPKDAPAASPKGVTSVGTRAQSIRLAQADTGGADTTGDEREFSEVIVTAQKRAQALVDVPISMSVLSAEDLEARRVQDVEDFIFNIPNATYNRSSIETTKVTLRGVGGNSGGKFSSTVVTVDDVAFGTVTPANLLSSRLLDAERIEVLRGPQGTLTGASAMGGVINLITKKPSTAGLELNGTLDVGRFDTYLVRASANLPASDSLAFRATAYTEQSNGAVRNLGPGGGNSGYDNYGVRLAARLLATERLTLDATYAKEEQRRGFRSSLFLDQFYSFADPDRDQAIAALAAAGADYFDTSFITDTGNNGGNWFSDLKQYQDSDNEMYSAKASLDLGRHTVSLVYGGQSSSYAHLVDRDKSELAVNRMTQIFGQDTHSAELRTQSNYDGPVNWVAGLVYGKEEWGTDLVSIEPGDGTIGGSYEPFLFVQGLTTYESTGVFGNVFWDITDRLHLTGGARWSKSKSTDAIAFGIGSMPPLPNALKASLDQIDPRIALNFDLTDDVTAYVQYATGHRVGYGNDPAAAGVRDSTIGQVNVPAEVANERVKNYEVGVKGQFFDRRVSLAAAAFHVDYTDMQIFGGCVLPAQDFCFDLNAGEAWSRGFEIEAALRPVRGLELQASLGHVETRLKTLFGERLTDNTSAANVRPWTGSLTGRYQRPVSARLNGSVQAAYTWQDKPDPSFNESFDTSGYRLPSFSTLDLNVGIAGEKWSVHAYFDNVLDEIWWLDDYGGLTHRGIEAYFVPRTYGLRVNIQY